MDRLAQQLPSILIILLPTYLIRFQVGFVKFNLLDVVLLASLIFTLIYYRHQLKWHSCFGWMVSFWLIGAIAVLTAPDILPALGLYKSIVVLPSCVAIIMLFSQPTLASLRNGIQWSVGYISFITVIQLLSMYGIPSPWHEWGSGNFRLTSIYPYPNAVGLILAPWLSFMLACWFLLPQYRQPWNILIMFLAIFSIIASRSDGAIVAVMACLMVILLLAKKYYVAGVLILLGLGLVIFVEPIQEVLLFQDTSGEVRLALWEGTINMLRDRPWLGAGLGGFDNLYAQYKLDRHVEFLLYPHNIWLNFWVNLGLAGLIWLAILFTKLLRFAWEGRVHKELHVGMIGLLSMFIYGIVDVPYFKNDLAVIFWLFISYVFLFSTFNSHQPNAQNRSS